MTRKLLPYEHELIKTLGVTKEEYLDFVAQQQIYSDIKEGTTLDVRNDFGLTALILTVVGVLFQVAAALLTPKPEIRAPRFEGQEQTRDQRLSPRLGFNSTQELARYGDTISVVYTNTTQNSSGGVRLSTLLLWSAILSFGNNQFMRLMLNIGAANITTIDPNRTAFGQFPVKNLVFGNVWQYYNANGPTRFSNLLQGTQADPVRTTPNDFTAGINPGGIQGFSQAFSPTTASAAGVTGFIPINYNLTVLNSEGKVIEETVKTSFAPDAGSYWSGSTPSTTPVPVGLGWTLIVPNTSETYTSDDLAPLARQDALRGIASLIDNGTQFKAGSAIFRVESVSFSSGNFGIETGNLLARLVCTRSGLMPTLGYNILSATQIEIRIKELEDLIDKNNGGARNRRRNAVVTTRRTPTAGSIADYERRLAELRQTGPFSATNTNRFPPGSTPGGRAVPRTTNNRFSSSIPKKANAVTSARSRGTNTDRQKIYNDEITSLENTIKQLKDQNLSAQEEIVNLKALLKTDYAVFHTKGLARFEESSYASVTSCNVLDFAIRYMAYRRISGRSNVYGSKQIDHGHGASDNGIKARTAMFTLWYRLNSTGDFRRVPYIFCCRNTNEQNIFAYFKLIAPSTKVFWEARLEPVIDPPAEFRTFDTRGFCYLTPSSGLVTLNGSTWNDGTVQVQFNGSVENATSGLFPPYNKTPPESSEFDLFNYDSYTNTSFSFDSGPEISITAVSEQTFEPWSNYPDLYQDLSNLSLHVLSGAGTQDLRSVSVWVSEGKRLREISTALNAYGNEATGEINSGAINALVVSAPSRSSSYAPDIFLDTILDSINGIGQYASIHSVDVAQLAQSKRFCIRNRLFMDGAITSGRSWRSFWAETAPFSLLELGKIGGRDTLLPAVPYDKTTGQITRSISVTALFNQGNILQDSYKEEFIDYGSGVQDIVLTIIYRDVERDGAFPRNNSVEVQRADTSEAIAIRETVDMSQFVTTRAQAILVGKYLCQIRRYNRRAVEFKTFPMDMPVMPGAYIYVETADNQWDGIYTGRIETGGALNVPLASTIPNGTYNVLTYDSNGVRQFNSVQVNNNICTTLAASVGDLFVLGQAVKARRTFRITEVSMEEEGETTIRAVEHPCDVNGNSLITQGLADSVPGLFLVDGVPS